ncbi:MAG: nuclear transport factor 2 family protein [Chromatiales bacterium]|nr:nuclear transport factor 2 family protein [Chromatiales bacterium]
MLLRSIPLLVVLSVLAAPPAQSGGHGAQAGDAREARLRERLAEFSRAFAEADVAALDDMLAPNYLHTNDRAAPLDRAEWLASMERRRADIESGALVTTEFTTSEFRLEVAGSTAVATGLSVMRGRRGDHEFGLRIRFTNVWAYEGGDWYRVAFHDTYEQLAD